MFGLWVSVSVSLSHHVCFNEPGGLCCDEVGTGSCFWHICCDVEQQILYLCSWTWFGSRSKSYGFGSFVRAPWNLCCHYRPQFLPIWQEQGFQDRIRGTFLSHIEAQAVPCCRLQKFKLNRQVTSTFRAAVESFAGSALFNVLVGAPNGQKWTENKVCSKLHSRQNVMHSWWIPACRYSLNWIGLNWLPEGRDAFPNSNLVFSCIFIIVHPICPLPVCKPKTPTVFVWIFPCQSEAMDDEAAAEAVKYVRRGEGKHVLNPQLIGGFVRCLFDPKELGWSRKVDFHIFELVKQQNIPTEFSHQVSHKKDSHMTHSSFQDFLSHFLTQKIRKRRHWVVPKAWELLCQLWSWTKPKACDRCHFRWLKKRKEMKDGILSQEPKLNSRTGRFGSVFYSQTTSRTRRLGAVVVTPISVILSSNAFDTFSDVKKKWWQWKTLENGCFLYLDIFGVTQKA